MAAETLRERSRLPERDEVVVRVSIGFSGALVFPTCEDLYNGKLGQNGRKMWTSYKLKRVLCFFRAADNIGDLEFHKN